ncbi:alpha/beta fold hydrolase [Microbacterium sp. 18062]|uniref:alpha/beta fold hydrolase n=1 Tax=Microbacterium sp. 18062 TaxID=2681410 RepID=UPI0013592E25|nr:alpha/beta hydrolase [Microbacterium sp. 18062]
MPSDLHVARSGDGPPIVLLHGGGPGCSCETDFAEVVPVLAVFGTVVGIDLDNFGASGDVVIDGPAVRHHADRVAGALDEAGVRHAVFVCQSLGGTVALALAAERPDLVARLVLTGSQPVPADIADSDEGLGSRLRQDLFAGGPDETGMRRLMAAAEWHDASRIPDRLVRARLSNAAAHHAVIPGDHPTGRGAPTVLTDVLGTVAQHVLLVWGEHDPFASPDYAREVARRLPRADLRVIAAAAHHPQSERPEEYLRAVLPFVVDARVDDLPAEETIDA